MRLTRQWTARQLASLFYRQAGLMAGSEQIGEVTALPPSWPVNLVAALADTITRYGYCIPSL